MNVESRVYLVINGNQYQTELLTWDNFCSFGLELTSRPGDPGAPHQRRKRRRVMRRVHVLRVEFGVATLTPYYVDSIDNLFDWHL